MDSEARKRQIMVCYTLAAVLGVLLLQYFIASYPEVETISYSQFEQLLNADKIAEVTVKTDSIERPPGRFVAKRQEGCCQKDHANAGVEPVKLGEQLIERLLFFVTGVQKKSASPTWRKVQ